jgi:hypothetical protein
MKCPTCGHTPSTKRPKPNAIDIDLASASDADRRTYYARTAPFFDVQFMIDNGRGLSPALLSDARELAATVDASGHFAPGVTRASFYRQYAALSARRREERDAIYWRTVVIPAQKARAWARIMADKGDSIGTRIAVALMVRTVAADRRAQYLEAA